MIAAENNPLTAVIFDAEQKSKIARLTAMGSLEEQGLALMEELTPRWALAHSTVLCPGTCHECKKHAPMLFEAQKKSDMERQYLFCFMCWWKAIGTPWNTTGTRTVTGMTVTPA